MDEFSIVCDYTHKKKHQISQFNDNKTKENLPEQKMEKIKADNKTILKGERG